MNPNIAPAAGASVQAVAGSLADELRQRDERLAGFKRLVDILGHDFNNMLVPVLGYVGLLKEDADPASPAMTFLGKIETAARKTEKSIDTFLTMVRPRRRFEPQPGDFQAVIEEVVREWQAGLPSGAGITVEFSAEPCPGVLDPKLIGMLMAQLLSNVRYGLALGGRVRISLQPVVLSPAKSAELRVPESLYELTVADDGFGIPAEVLPQVWDPFFTTRPKGQGMGLGLTAVHSVAHLHGGQAVIESGETKGTKVTVWLARESRAGGDDRTGNEAGGKARTGRALIVEGDTVAREVLKGAIEGMGFETLCTADGAEGLKHFQRRPEMFHLVACGAEAARANDFALLRTVRELAKSLPVLVLAAEAEKEIEGVLAVFGPKRPRVIWKPATLQALRDAVQTEMS